MGSGTSRGTGMGTGTGRAVELQEYSSGVRWGRGMGKKEQAGVGLQMEVAVGEGNSKGTRQG